MKPNGIDIIPRYSTEIYEDLDSYMVGKITRDYYHPTLFSGTNYDKTDMIYFDDDKSHKVAKGFIIYKKLR